MRERERERESARAHTHTQERESENGKEREFIRIGTYVCVFLWVGGWVSGTFTGLHRLHLTHYTLHSTLGR